MSYEIPVANRGGVKKVSKAGILMTSERYSSVKSEKVLASSLVLPSLISLFLLGMSRC